MRISDWSSACARPILAGKRLGAAKADGELHDLERIEESERLRLAALQIEREGGAGTGAMAAVDVGLPRFGIEKAEIADTFHAGMVLQPCADLRRAFARARHAQLQRLKAPEQHPGGVRIGGSEENTSELKSLM